MAILEAFAALGRDASTKDVQGFMEQKYGLQASKDYISDQRMKLKKKKKTPTKAQPAKVKQAAAAKPPQVSKPASTNAVAKPAPSQGRAAVVANAVVALSSLATKIGWDEIESLVAVLRRK